MNLMLVALMKASASMDECLQRSDFNELLFRCLIKNLINLMKNFIATGKPTFSSSAMNRSNNQRGVCALLGLKLNNTSSLPDL